MGHFALLGVFRFSFLFFKTKNALFANRPNSYAVIIQDHIYFSTQNMQNNDVIEEESDENYRQIFQNSIGNRNISKF